MIGLSIIVPNNSNRYLFEILKDIELLNYKWAISADEVLYVENGIEKNSLFEDDIIDGEKLLQCIVKEDYYLIFADIKGYKLNGDISEVETYSDYLQSDCEFILLCTDSKFIDFYCKDKNNLKVVYDNCLRNHFVVDVITAENNLRSRMSVW